MENIIEMMWAIGALCLVVVVSLGLLVMWLVILSPVIIPIVLSFYGMLKVFLFPLMRKRKLKEKSGLVSPR